MESSDKVYLRDSVIMFNVKKDTLWCEELYWDKENGLFYTDKPVIMSQHDPAKPQQKIYAQEGMTSDQNFKNIVFKKVGKIYNGFDSYIKVKDSTTN